MMKSFIKSFLMANTIIIITPIVLAITSIIITTPKDFFYKKETGDNLTSLFPQDEKKKKNIIQAYL